MMYVRYPFEATTEDERKFDAAIEDYYRRRIAAMTPDDIERNRRELGLLVADTEKKPQPRALVGNSLSSAIKEQINGQR